LSDSIDADLLDYYQRELTWLRHAGAGFAQRYPKVARRLELAPNECQDPHVERLLEGFALLSARLHRRLDDDYAEFSDALLEQLYPLALRPLPSCAIVQFEPDLNQGSLAEGYTLPRDTPLFVTTRDGASIHLRTSADAVLWPLCIREATLLDGDAAVAFSGDPRARSALRLTLECLGEFDWAHLSVRSLRVHLAASPMTNATLYDLLGAHCLGVWSGVSRSTFQAVPGVIAPVGFSDDQALLPDQDGQHPGLRLLAEYFSFPDKFGFFDLPLLPPADGGRGCQLLIAFDRAPIGRLHLQAGGLRLGCAPAINLFPRTSEPLRPDGTCSEYRLIADAYRESSLEIHSVRSLRAATPQGVRFVEAYYGHAHGNASLYWHARRVQSLNPVRPGSDLLLSLVDTAFDPLQDTPEYSLTAELLCTNRHLAENLPAGTRLDFERPGPVAQASLLAPPTPQSLPCLSGPSRWRLVSQLSLNHLSLVEGPDALDALRELLHLHNLRDEAGSRRLVDGLVELTCERVLAWVGEDAWRGWRNGLEVRIRLDPLHFAGTSTVLFSAVLAQFFSLYATPNRFVRTVLVDTDKEIRTWQPQAGKPLSL